MIGHIQPFMSVLKEVHCNGISSDQINEWIKYQIDFKEVGSTPVEVLDYIQLNNRKFTQMVDQCILELKRDTLSSKKILDREETYILSSKLCKVLGVERSTMSKWIKNNKFPNIRTISDRKREIPLSNINFFLEENSRYRSKWDSNKYLVIE